MTRPIASQELSNPMKYRRLFSVVLVVTGLLSMSLPTFTTNRKVSAASACMGTPVNVSRGGNKPSGNPLNSASSHLSSDGRYLAFESEATTLAAPVADANVARDVFVWDRQACTISPISVSADGTAT